MQFLIENLKILNMTRLKILQKINKFQQRKSFLNKMMVNTSRPSERRQRRNCKENKEHKDQRE